MSIIAHDLVNPFNSLIGMSELLMNRVDELTAEERKNYSELIHSSAQSAFALLQNLLTWARSQTGRIRYLPEIFDLRTIIQDILSLNMVNLEAKSIHFESTCMESVSVFGDREMISTVLRNLVNNSIKFVPREGEIIMNARRENGKVRVEIRDTGIGISKEKIAEILNSTTINPGRGTAGELGSGLGLSLCKEFIRIHGGELEIQSELGKGTTFAFTLPTEDRG
jgi:two-component system, sensor histidine kinase and response regulator